jgi:hypothetical protein
LDLKRAGSLKKASFVLTTDNCSFLFRNDLKIFLYQEEHPIAHIKNSLWFSKITILKN